MGCAESTLIVGQILCCSPYSIDVAHKYLESLGSVAQVARGEVRCFKFSRDTDRTLTASEPASVGATANVLEDVYPNTCPI